MSKISLLNKISNLTVGTAGSPTQLAILRVVICLLILYFGPHELVFSPRTWSPQGIWSGASMILPGNFHSIYIIWKVLCVLGLIGLGGRWTLVPMGALTWFILSYSYNFNQFHSLTGLCFATIIISISKSTERLSLDYVFLKRFFPQQLHKWSKFSFIWPTRLIQAFIISVYSTSAITKLIKSGFQWALSDNLPIVLINSPDSTWIVSYLLQLPWDLIKLGGLIVLILELIAPIMIFSHKLRIIFALEILIFQLGVTLTIGGHSAFLSYPIIYLFTIPLSDWKGYFAPKS